ncbi:bacterial Ig-like domain-containing protein [Tissierella praeacuta]|uniref:bacterial Ig-like domain-containing protein n=1 Tax=Tissierella praeacuta TaxID=43131 RepID=UPI003511E702
MKTRSKSAINKTTVKVEFNKSVDAVKSSYFTIEGAKVVSAGIDNEMKVVTLDVSGLKSGKNYELKINGVLVGGKEQKELVKEFKVPTVEEQWDLGITVKNAKGEEVNSITGDGISTAVVSFELKDKATGEIDKNANDVVLFVSATRGKLSQERITIQNGKADMIIQSEFFADRVDAKIDAQVIEASPDYQELIGKVVGTKTIAIVPEGEEESPVTVVSIISANSNEADRVTVTFDGAVKAEDFYTVDNAGNATINPGVIEITQKADKTDKRKIAGVLLDSSNPKKAIIVLAKKDDLGKDNQLIDNKDVRVGAKIGDRATMKEVTFKLTDARKPNLTSANANGTNDSLTLKFSEPVHKAKFVIDGRFDQDPTEFKATYGDIYYSVKDGKYVDERNVVTIELQNGYQEPEKNTDGSLKYPAGYFKPGKHSIEASDIYDFAAITDSNNIGTTQVLEFNIDEIKGDIEIVKEVDSPEQFRVRFDKPVAFYEEANPTVASDFETEMKFEVYNANENKWVEVDGTYFDKAVGGVNFSTLLKVKDLGRNEYKIELTEDWTLVYDTQNTKNNYYNDSFRIRLPKGTVLNSANGKRNEKDLVVDLSNNTALSTPDTVSPRIAEMEMVGANSFDVTMTEPVKLEGHLDSSASETLGQGQTSLPTTLVRFLGKDKNGKTLTFIGEVNGYANVDTDTVINVSWLANSDGDTPQTIVDDGGSKEWTLVVMAISDDVGNTAATVTKEFELEPAVAPIGKFMVVPTGGTAIGDDGVTDTFKVKGTKEAGNLDEVEVVFTEEVTTSGIGSATNVKNYTINGRELPVGSSIRVASDDKTVTIKLPEGTLKGSNVIVLARHLVSAKGNTLVGDVSFTFDVASPVVTVTGITVKTAPTKVTYNDGENLDLTGLIVELTKSDGTTEDVAFEDFTANGITVNPDNGDSLTAGTTDVTIEHTASGKSVVQNITVNPAVVTVTGITVKTAPTKVTYNDGENLDLTGLVVELTKSDGTTEDVAFEDFTANGITVNPDNGDSLTAGTTDVTIEHTASGKSVVQNITVN